MVFKIVHTNAGCNRSPHCMDWGQNNYIIYGACNAVILMKYEKARGGKFEQTLVGHQKLVTSVRWISKGESKEETEFISTSTDGTAIIWSFGNNCKFSPYVMQGHTNAVQIADAVYLDENFKNVLLVTTSADSTVKIWTRIDTETNCIQTISFGHGLATEVKLTLLKDPLLAAALDDFKINLYSPNSEGVFTLHATLLGHEDWIRGLDFIKENSNIFLASGSQDGHFRIWKISENNQLRVFSESLRLKDTLFRTADGKIYQVSLESVVRAHEDWIYSVKWHWSASTGSLNLLTTSMDKTVILWEFSMQVHMWIEKATLGAVGGTMMGFFGGVFSPNRDSIAAHGFQGAIYIWNYNKYQDSWQLAAPIGGHFGPVQDISWDPEGAYLMSCGLDQTTRLYAPWRSQLEEESVLYNWSEIARPQVHGYDLICLSTLNRYKFVSGADEKILRVFEAPRSFAVNLKNLCNIDTSSYLMESLPEGASVPSLGLSNRAVFDEDISKAEKERNEPKHVREKYPEFCYTPVVLSEPPSEDSLLQNTLWPEVQKLYGHPYEVFTVATNHKGSLIASACKASKAEHGAIILWDAYTLKKLGQLQFHALTITQLEFSPDDEYLLSVSRDRMWAVHQRCSGEIPYKTVANLDKKSAVHSRIIWSCSWSHDSLYFATSSRDKKVAVWGKNNVGEQLFTLAASPVEVKDSATAVSFAPSAINNRYIIAVGLENGQILMYSWAGCGTSLNLHIVLDKNDAHHLTVNRLRFSPYDGLRQYSGSEKQDLVLASCGNDHLIRIYRFDSSFCESST